MIAIQSDAQHGDATAVHDLLNPAYWLVIGLEWQDDSIHMSEAAVAVAPGMIPRDVPSHDAFQVLGCADLYARKYAQRVVFLSDLTRMFATAGTSWSQLGIDWESALAELKAGPFPAMFLTISERAYIFICNPVVSLLGVTSADREATDDERELVRAAITRQLVADWSPYVRAIIDAGRVSLAG